MKKYLILAAQKEELDALFNTLNFTVEESNQLEVKVYQDKNVILYGLMSGIGKVSMAFTMGLFFANHDVDYVINIGVAGSISSQLRKMQTFVSDKVAYWDVDLTKFGHPVGEMSDCPLYFLADEQLKNKAVSLLGQSGNCGLIISGDSFISKENIKKEWYTQFENPLACDMESAAVAQVCYRQKIPFLIIRSISDDPVNDKDNSEEYEFNLSLASNQAGKLVFKLIFNK